jgi:hypothetical protein
MPRISLSTATPIRALRAWENNLVIARDRWNKTTETDLKRSMLGHMETSIQVFARFLGHWPEFVALGLRAGDDGLEAHEWHDGMGEMLDLLPEHYHLEFVYPNQIGLLLFGTPYMFYPRGHGMNNAHRMRGYEHRFRKPHAVVNMRLEEQLVAVRARIIAVRREEEKDALIQSTTIG